MTDPVTTWFMSLLEKKLVTTTTGALLAGFGGIGLLLQNLNASPPVSVTHWDNGLGLIGLAGVVVMAVSEGSKFATKIRERNEEKRAAQIEAREAIARNQQIASVARKNIVNLTKVEAEVLLWLLARRNRRFRGSIDNNAVRGLSDAHIIRRTKVEDGLSTPDQFYVEPEIWKAKEEITAHLVKVGYSAPELDMDLNELWI